jgi:hypothetical protein
VKFIKAALLFGWGLLICGVIDAAKGVDVAWVVNVCCSLVGVGLYLAFSGKESHEHV